MTIQTYSIEFRLDVGDDQHEAMEALIKQYATDLLAGALLLSGGKKPQVVCRIQDSFYDTKEVELFGEQG